MAEAHPGGLPVGRRGARARGRGDPRRSTSHPHERAREPLRALPRRRGHRVPRRHHQLHPRERSRIPRLRGGVHQRAGDHHGGLPRHRGPRRLLLGLEGRRRLRHDLLAVRGHGGSRLGRTARVRRDDGRAGRARRAGRDARERRATRGGSDAAAPSLRVPASQAPLLALHARFRRGGLRRPARAVPRRVRGAVLQLRSRAHRRDRVLRRLDTAHRRCPVHPRCSDHPAAAGQHREAWRGHPGAARACVDPGFDRHPDALQHPAGLPPDAALRGASRPRDVHRAERVAVPASGGTWARTP